MMTIQDFLEVKLSKIQKSLLVGLSFICAAALIIISKDLFNFSGLFSLLIITCIFIALPFLLYAEFNIFFGIKCPNCKKSLGYHITCKCKQNMPRCCQSIKWTFSVSKDKIKKCPFCNIVFDTPMSEVKGVKLISPEYKSFHVYLKEKPYIKEEKEN